MGVLTEYEHPLLFHFYLSVVLSLVSLFFFSLPSFSSLLALSQGEQVLVDRRGDRERVIEAESDLDEEGRGSSRRMHRQRFAYSKSDDTISVIVRNPRGIRDELLCPSPRFLTLFLHSLYPSIHPMHP